MTLRDEFHCFLDKTMPTWRRDLATPLYSRLFDAFDAGFKLCNDGIAPASLGVATGEPVPILQALVAKPRKFKPPATVKRRVPRKFNKRRK